MLQPGVSLHLTLIQDKGLLRAIRAKIPSFEGSRELDLTLANVLRLEQKLGKEIHWVHGPTFDDLIKKEKTSA